MGRRARPHLPGATFHLTARLHGREALFTPEVRTALVTILREQVVFSDVELFAYVVMPNHLHLVVRQGRERLSRFMQPLLRRVALLVQRAWGREGHVFERRYRDRPCSDPDHIRNAIVYTHLNPVRAGLCAEPGEYAWSSHGAWIGGENAADGRTHPVSLERAAQLFASGPARTPSELAEDYLAFLQWRQAIDEAEGNDEVSDTLPPRPLLEYTDPKWAVHVTPLGADSAGDTLGDGGAPYDSTKPGPLDAMGRSYARNTPASHPDLSAIAQAVIRATAPGLDPAWVRSRWGGPDYVRARHDIIRRAAAAGYRRAQIASYLRISTKTVSAVLAAERRRLLMLLKQPSASSPTTPGRSDCGPNSIP